MELSKADALLMQATANRLDAERASAQGDVVSAHALAEVADRMEALARR